MHLSALFPDFFDKHSDKQNPLWEASCDSFGSEEAEMLYSLAGPEFFGHDAEKVKQLGIAILTDVIRLKNDKPTNLIFPFLQFQFATSNAHFLMGKKLLIDLFNWVSNALDDNLDGVERNVDFNRLDEFLQSDIRYISDNILTFLSLWVGALHYEARVQGGNNRVANEFFNSFLDWYLSRSGRFPEIDFYSFSLTQMQSWAIQHKRIPDARKIASVLISLYNIVNNSEVVKKKQIAMHFSCVDVQPHGYSRSDWGDILQGEYFEYLSSHERLQMFVNMYRGKDNLTEQEFKSLNDAFEFYHQSIAHLDTGTRSYEQVQIYSILSPLLIQFSRAGNVDQSNKLIANYFTLGEPKQIRVNTIHLIPNDEEGIFACSIGEAAKIDGNPHHYIPIITLTKSEFLGTVTALKDDIDFVVPAPQRLGVPTPEKGEAFHTALTEYFTLNGIADFWQRHRIDGYYLFSGINYPLQSIMMEQLNFIIPYVVSFQVPAPLRKIKNVLVWKGVSLYADLECNGLMQLLQARQISVTLLDAANANKEDFLASYHQEEYDLVWCCAHGEFNHYSPHESYLELSENIRFSIDDLEYSNSPLECRRLFFLNACDGATTSLYNSPISIGIGQNMINSQQSLFSHLWPAQPLAAAIHAWLFAGFLQQSQDPTEIYCLIARVIKEGRQRIISTLEEFALDDDLVERVRQAELDFSQFYYWGSLAYFE